MDVIAGLLQRMNNYISVTIVLRNSTMRRLAYLLLVAASAAIAQTPQPRTATVTLTAPNAWEDGTTLNCSAATPCTYNVYRGVCGGGLKTRVITGSTSTAIPVPNSTPGQCFTASAVVNGIESAQSAEARYRGNPNPPTITVIVTVTVETQT